MSERPLMSDLASDVADTLAAALAEGGDVPRIEGQRVLRLLWQLRDALEDREADERRAALCVDRLPAGVIDLAAARAGRATGDAA